VVAPLRAGQSWAGPLATELVFLHFFFSFIIFYWFLFGSAGFFSPVFCFADWFFVNFTKFDFFLI
jgi:hypothetical protein